MNFFVIINKLYFSLLLILPFFSLSQNYVDDIYYSDNEVNYNFLDKSIETINDTELNNNDEEYFYDENFTYYDKIDRFSDISFDHYWNYNFYYSPWDLHYYNYHGINSINWPYYNGWGITSYFNFGYPYYNWGISNYHGLGWSHYGLGWGHYGLGWGHYGLGLPYYGNSYYSNNSNYNNNNSNYYFGNRITTNTNQQTTTNQANNSIINSREKKDINLNSFKTKNNRRLNNNKSFQKLNNHKSSNKRKNNVLKEFLNDISKEVSEKNYNRSRSSKSDKSNQRNFQNSNKKNYNSNKNSIRNTRNSFNNSSRSKSNSSRRKP